jgi:hypothetical protein
MVEGLNILRPWSIPPRAIAETIEAPAFALGFLLSAGGFYRSRICHNALNVIIKLLLFKPFGEPIE